jgi:hypothetical protein
MFSRRHIPRCTNNELDIAGGIKHRLEDIVIYPENTAISREGDLSANHLPGANDFLNFAHVHVGMPGWVAQLMARSPHNLVECLGPYRQETRIRVKKAALGIENVGKIVRRRKNRFVESRRLSQAF